MVSAPSKPDKKYFSIAETSFKDRFGNYTRDCRHEKYINSTELSKYMLKLNDELSTLCRGCRFACQQRVLKTFPDPGYLRSKDGVV